MKGLYVLFCTLILGASCTRQKNTNNLTEKHLWTIDVTKKYPTKDIYLQDIADVDYIPLETNDSILWVGREIVYMDEDYIIGASGKNGVYFHSKTGKALYSFHKEGQGPEEYTGFSLIQYDKKSDEVYIKSFNDKYLVYDSKGKFKRTFKVGPFQNLRERVSQFFILNTDEFIEYLGEQNHFRRISRQTGKHLGDIKLPSKDSTLTLMYRRKSDGMLFSTILKSATIIQYTIKGRFMSR